MLELINSAWRTYNSRRVHIRLIKADFTTDQSITPLEGRPSLINLHQLLKESGVETYRSFITVRGRLINLPFLGTMIAMATRGGQAKSQNIVLVAGGTRESFNFFFFFLVETLLYNYCKIT